MFIFVVSLLLYIFFFIRVLFFCLQLKQNAAYSAVSHLSLTSTMYLYVRNMLHIWSFISINIDHYCHYVHFFEGCDFTNVLSGVWYSGKQKICNADLDLNINILYIIRPQRTLQWAIQVVTTGVTWGNFYSIRRCWENKYCKEFHQQQIKKRMTMNTILSMLIDIQLTVCIKL